MRLAGIAAMGDFWRVVREFNPEGIEREATSPLHLWIVGEPGAGKRTLAESLIGAGERAGEAGPFRILDVDPRQARVPEAENPDLIILVVSLNQDLTESGRLAASL